MLYFFIGFFFLLLDFPIAIGGGSLNLMPACVGGVLVLLGIGQTCDGTPRFLRMRLSSALLVVLNLARTVTDILGIGDEALWHVLAQGFEMLLALYLAYEIAEYVKAKEKAASRPLGGKDLASAWFLLTFGNLLSFLAGRVESIALLCLVLQLLSVVWYQTALWRAHKKMRVLKK